MSLHSKGGFQTPIPALSAGPRRLDGSDLDPFQASHNPTSILSTAHLHACLSHVCARYAVGRLHLGSGIAVLNGSSVTVPRCIESKE